MNVASNSNWLLLSFGAMLLVNAVASRSAQAECTPEPHEVLAMELESVTLNGVDKTDPDFSGYRDWDWQLVSTETGWTVQVTDVGAVETEQEYVRE